MRDPSFEWIIRDWSALTDGFGETKTVELRQFLRRCGGLEAGIDEDNWRGVANEWGRSQSPPIDVNQSNDASTVILRKRG